MSHNDHAARLYRRIAVGLGSAAGGLVAAAWLPMATAHGSVENDFDPFEDAGFTDGRTIDALLTPTVAAQLDSIIDNTNISISYDGVTLLQIGSAAADSGRLGDLAVAIGPNSIANAGVLGGSDWFNTAFADGDKAIAASGAGNFNDAYAIGAGSISNAGGSIDNLSSGNFADAVGDLTSAIAGTQASQVPSGFDTAFAFDPTAGPNETTVALATQGFGDLATAFGQGTLAEAGLAGSFDFGAALSDGVSSTGATAGNFLVDVVP
jgi:hypothetical protein